MRNDQVHISFPSNFPTLLYWYCRLGLPVPPGCIITTETCLDYFKLNHTESEIDYFIEDKKIPDHLEEGYLAAIKKIEIETGKKFGAAVEDGKPPLLLAIRAGAAVSIPG
jgi:pyruvate, orthophosphate dikinase